MNPVAIRIIGNLALAYVMSRKSRKSRKQEREFHASTHARMLYLASMLDKSGVEIDEFDLIALQNM